jgi:hypothetical protein
VILVLSTAGLPADVRSDWSTAVQPRFCTSSENAFSLFRHKAWSGVSCQAAAGKQTARAERRKAEAQSDV